MNWGWTYIGTVSSLSNVTLRGKHVQTKFGRWILREHRVFGRSAKLIGDAGNSEYAQDIRAKVLTWKRGGTLPALDQDTRQQPAATVLKLHDGGKS